MGPSAVAPEHIVDDTDAASGIGAIPVGIGVRVPGPREAKAVPRVVVTDVAHHDAGGLVVCVDAFGVSFASRTGEPTAGDDVMRHSKVLRVVQAHPTVLTIGNSIPDQLHAVRIVRDDARLATVVLPGKAIVGDQHIVDLPGGVGVVRAVPAPRRERIRTTLDVDARTIARAEVVADVDVVGVAEGGRVGRGYLNPDASVVGIVLRDQDVVAIRSAETPDVLDDVAAKYHVLNGPELKGMAIPDAAGGVGFCRDHHVAFDDRVVRRS